MWGEILECCGAQLGYNAEPRRIFSAFKYMSPETRWHHLCDVAWRIDVLAPLLVNLGCGLEWVTEVREMSPLQWDVFATTTARIDAYPDRLFGLSPLHWAIILGRSAHIHELIHLGWWNNAINARGETPLMFATMLGLEAVVAHLLEAGADPCTQIPHAEPTVREKRRALPDRSGQTALGMAVEQDLFDIANMLVAAGGDFGSDAVNPIEHVRSRRAFELLMMLGAVTLDRGSLQAAQSAIAVDCLVERGVRMLGEDEADSMQWPVNQCSDVSFGLVYAGYRRWYKPWERRPLYEGTPRWRRSD